MDISDWDAAHIFEIVEQNHGNWWNAHLLRLIRSADEDNRERLRKSYTEARQLSLTYQRECSQFAVALVNSLLGYLECPANTFQFRKVLHDSALDQPEL